jgi:hypothetical protein
MAPFDLLLYTFDKSSRTIVRELLSKKHTDRPIQQVIDAGMVPHLIELLTKSQLPKLQFEAAWALTNIVSGSSEHVAVCVKAGIVPKMTQLLDSTSDDVREQAVWAIRLLLSQMNNSDVCDFFNGEIMRMKHHDCSEEVKVFKSSASSASPRLSAVSSARIA